MPGRANEWASWGERDTLEFLAAWFMGSLPRSTETSQPSSLGSEEPFKMRGACTGNLILGPSGEGSPENVRGVRQNKSSKEGAGKAFQEKGAPHAIALRSKGGHPGN